MKLRSCSFALALLAMSAGCGSDDSAGEPYVPEAYGQWLKFEPEGAVCANGSQYKYFINFSETSDNVVIFFEGGGACWDYEDCANGRPFNTECIKDPGAECIRDDYPAVYLHLAELEPLSALTEPLGVVNGDVPVELAYPMLSSNPAISPMADWNKVFVTYCTGDTYLGNVVQTYTDPEGVGPDVEFHHMGHQNTLLVIEDLNRKFHNIPKMMVSGCSAGGIGSLNNYAFLRDGMEGAQNAYLISDSGPVIPSMLLDGEPSHSTALYQRIRSTWGVDATIEALPGGSAERILADFGEVNAVLAEMFPDDRLSMSMFERDYNVPVNSYEDFFEIFSQPESSVNTAAGRTEIYRLASEDLAALRAQLDEIDNFAYYMPYYRNTNDSHCLTVTGLEDVGSSAIDFISAFQSDPSAATWAGTEIETNAGTVTFKDQIENVLDDAAPLQSHYEGPCEGKYQVCARDCDAYDPAMCEAVVGQ